MRFPSAANSVLVVRWGALPGNFRGILWALLAALAFSCMQVVIKEAGQTLPVWQILLLRSLISLAFIAPAVFQAGVTSLKTTRPRAHATRALLGFGGISTLVLSLKHLDLTIVATLGFSSTFFVILFAALFLGERIVRARTLATVIGFIGVLICLNPGAGGFDPWALVMLASAVFAAGVHTTIKSLTGTERPTTILFWSYFGIMALSAIPAYFTWVEPSWRDLALIGALAVCTTLGQSCIVLALRAGEAVAVAPCSYTRILYATGFGFFLYGALPALSTVLGASIIISSTLYLAVRERRSALPKDEPAR